MSAQLDTIGTPCLVLDRLRLDRNLARMAAAVASQGVTLRPHLKTAKSIDVARLAAPRDDAPVTVSTLLEAEHFFGHGYRDIFYAVALGPGKIPRAANLVGAGARLITLVDSVAVARAIRKGAAHLGAAFRTVVEIDSGTRRGGLEPRDPLLIEVARALGPHFAGVATHAGHAYDARSPEQHAGVARQEADSAREAVAALRAAGLAPSVVSAGSSPTALAGVALSGSGITELRAGVYMFWDLMQAGLGLCRLEDLALSVLAEVIGRPAGRNEFLIDAGAFALSKDMSTAALPPPLQAKYGLVCDIDGHPLPGLRVERVWQEHGLVTSQAPLDPDAFPIGTRVRILPNHACPTASAYDRYRVVSGGRTIVAEWPRFSGW